MIEPLADHAAEQSDRWLFIALLLIVGSVIVFLWRWIVSDRAATSRRLESMTDRHIAAQDRLVEVVTNNTTALHEVREILVSCRGWQAMQNLRPEDRDGKWIRPHKHEND